MCFLQLSQNGKNKIHKDLIYIYRKYMIKNSINNKNKKRNFLTYDFYKSIRSKIMLGKQMIFIMFIMFRWSKSYVF